MISYEKWKMLNETLGPISLGVKTPHSFGVRGVVVGEELPTEDDVDSEESDDDSHDDVPYDKQGSDKLNSMSDSEHEEMSDEEDMEGEEESDEEDMEDAEDEEESDEEDMEDAEDEEESDEEDMEDIENKFKNMGESAVVKKPRSFLESVTGMMAMEEIYRLNKKKK
jgi:hypothetical protein